MTTSVYAEVKIESLAHPEPGSFKIGPFGSSLKKEELVKFGIPVVGIENVLPNRFVASFRRFITKEKLEQLSHYLIRPGDVLVTTMGTIGRAAVVPDDIGTAIIDSHLFRMRIDQAKVYPAYLCYALNGYRNLQEEIIRMASGAIMAGLNTTILKTCSIPLPSLPEQKRIAAILNEQMAAMERAWAAAEAELEAAKVLPAAYLRAIFNSAEAQQWNRVSIASISSLVIDGPHVTPFYVPNGIPFLTVRNIVNRRIELSEVSYISASDHAEFTRRGKAQRGDILYTKDGTLGIPCVVETDLDFSFFVSVALIKLRRDRVDPYFVAFALESPNVLEQVKLLGAGAGLKHMVLKSIRALDVPLPGLSIQRRIAARLSEQMAAAERTRKTLEEQLDTINKLPAALLRRAFSGEL